MIENNEKYHFECIDCGQYFQAGNVAYLCPTCKNQNTEQGPPRGVLKTLYDYETLKKGEPVLNALARNGYIDLLPLQKLDTWPNLKIGNTPLYKVGPPQKEYGFDLYLKDDSQNPSFSFKDRASALVSAYARQQNIETIVTASTGNAGSSIAAICANQKQKAVVLVPSSAPKAKLAQIVMYGARIVPVNGSYDDAFELSRELTEHFGWYNRNTAYNPFTIEGKKTVAFELAQQMGSVPDNIFVPVGDGVIISGVYKGFEDLLLLGLIDRIPKIIAVQSENSDNLIRNLETDEFRINSHESIADSITVDIPRNFYMAKKYIAQYNGDRVSVGDEAIMEASGILASKYGLFTEPAAAASMAGLLKYASSGKIEEGSKTVLLLTGSGLKDLKSIEPKIHIPKAVNPDLDSIKSFLNG